jgi:peptidoglycan hydrolase-like protein with peptidoglycan-binding domain
MSEFKHESEKYGVIDLMTLYGAQSALQVLGYDPGVADGLDGPKTQAAVKAFQTDAEIGVDGIVGPETRGALYTALSAAAERREDVQAVETYSNNEGGNS